MELKTEFEITPAPLLTASQFVFNRSDTTSSRTLMFHERVEQTVAWKRIETVTQAVEATLGEYQISFRVDGEMEVAIPVGPIALTLGTGDEGTEKTRVYVRLMPPVHIPPKSKLTATMTVYGGQTRVGLAEEWSAWKITLECPLYAEVDFVAEPLAGETGETRTWKSDIVALADGPHFSHP
ncbi:hypothetical protein [Nocardia sp. NPDC051832]|uniref:hypothetical protein n=1 Tax=Nocardia sp. NPDC051832 TaxID=3155673 RepID=UPI003441865A